MHVEFTRNCYCPDRR